MSLETPVFKAVLFDGAESILGELNPELCEIIEVESLRSDATLTLTYPLNDGSYPLLKDAFSIAIPDMDVGWNVYDIAQIEEDIVAGICKVYAENRFIELLTEPIKTLTFSSLSPYDVIPQILNGTRWILGICEISNLRTWGILDSNPLSALRDLETLYDGYLRFRAVLSPLGIEIFFVDFVERLGGETGLEFDLSHNMENITITTDKRGLVTALYGRGQGEAVDDVSDGTERLTFADVVWVAPADPLDKPLGQDWIGDETARTAYGKPSGTGGKRHIYGVYESQAKTAETLIQETYEQLAKRSQPSVNVKAAVVDLERVNGFEHEKVRLGDTVLVKVPEANQYLETEVISIKRDRLRPEQTELEFGNYQRLMVDDIRGLQSSTKRADARSRVWDRSDLLASGTLPADFLADLVEEMNARLNATGGYVFQEPGQGILTLDAPDIATATMAIQIVGGAFRIANSKDINGDFQFTTFGDGNGFIADSFIGGLLAGGKVKFDLTNGTLLIGNSTSDYNLYFDGTNLNIANGTFTSATINGGTITLEGSDSLYPMVINDSIDDGSTDYGSRAVRINTSAGAALSCFMGRISDAGVLWLRDTVDPTNNNITISAGSGMATVKDLYARNNVSALSFTDRTPFFKGDALAEIKKIKGVNGEVDHGTLPDFARVKKQAAKIKKVKGKDVEIFEEVEERDLGAMISILTVGIQQLTERLEKLEKK